MLLLFSDHDKSDSTAQTAVAEHLFRVNDASTSLTQETATMFHNFVAQCLFLTKRARPDISTAVAFLTTHVKGPDKNNWKKLVQVICYLRVITQLPLILRTDRVDGSHATHPNMRGHTGGCMSLGDGMPINTSTKQKINT
jgi:hypothetical protein